jgi:23S rRNA (cytosine1962-C5)-methyltransferase
METKFIEFQNRLSKVYKHLSKQAQNKKISCYRIYDKDLPNHPLIIDWYEGEIVIYEYESNHNLSEDEYEDWLQTCLLIIQEVLSVAQNNIYLKSRRRKKNRLDQYQKTGAENEFHIVHENGLKFKTNYSDFLDTGLFLDHRPTRVMVKNESEGKNILNLFCYTGSFSIYAAAAKANEVWSLDLSNSYINWGKENEALNNIDKSVKMNWIKCDVLAYLPELPDHKFDIIILDPPTFSNSKMMRDIWDCQQDHYRLIQNLARVLKPNGKIYFSTNARKFILDARLPAYWDVKDITKATTDFDFQGKLLRYCYLLQIKE